MTEAHRKQCRILLIDDDARQTEHVSDLIREVTPCQIDIISDLSRSLAWLGKAAYHLVVIDSSKLRKRAVLSVIDQIKRIHPETSVLVLTESAEVEEAVAAIHLGAEDYFKKPYHVDALKLAIKRGLDRKDVFAADRGVSRYVSLIHTCQMISGTLDQSKIFAQVQSYVMRELNCAYVAVYSLQKRDLVRVDRQAGPDPQAERTFQQVMDVALHASGAIHALAETQGTFQFVPKGTLTPGLFAFRFRCAGQSDYFCVGLSPEAPASFESFESCLSILKNQIEVTGKNIEEYLGIQHLVYVDDATGLYNTRYLSNVLDREIAAHEQSKRSFAVLFIDADRFKSINDSHGHLVGTKLLFELGDHLKRFLRQSDTVFRYGGDEFVAVLANADLKTAERVAERIRESVEGKSFLESEGLDIRFTISIGIALFPQHANSKRQIMEAADRAMYDAKKTSRNRVSLATGYLADKKVRSG